MPQGPTPARSSWPLILLLIGGAAYGTIFSANKIAIEGGFPFVAFTFYQALVAGLVLLVMGLIQGDRPGTSGAHLRQYGVTALFGFIVPFVVFSFVADKLPPSIITLLLALTPALTYLFAFLLRLERFRWLSVFGVLLGFAGILLIVLPRGSLPSPDMAGWVLLALLGPLGFAMNNVAVALLRPAASTSATLSAGVLIVSAVVLLIIMLAVEGFVWIGDLSTNAILGLLWASAVNGLTFLVLFEIIRLAGPVFFAQFNYVSVAAGILWALILFADVPSLWVWLALAVLAVGLVLANAGATQSVREREVKAA
jgi:drug/metabolite transporter (DMT)-like permease